MTDWGDVNQYWFPIGIKDGKMVMRNSATLEIKEFCIKRDD